MKIKVAVIIGAVLSIINIRADVAYFNGPPFTIPEDDSGAATVDLNGDGKVDFSFSSGPFVCTASYPISFCEGDFYIQAMGNNTVLQNGYQAVIVPAGTTIGSATPTVDVWTNNPNGATLAVAYFGSLLATNLGPITSLPGLGTSNILTVPTSGWSGPLAMAGIGYIGVAINEPDGVHYGWIHAWLPDGAAFATTPTIVDWAYETWPNTAIAAGMAPVALQAPPEEVRAGFLRLKWAASPGFAYQAQFRSDLNSPVWTSMDFEMVATGNTVAVDVPLIGGGAGFYRIVRMP